MKLYADAFNGVVWRDDSQVDELHIRRAEVVRGGKAVVQITEVAA